MPFKFKMILIYFRLYILPSLLLLFSFSSALKRTMGRKKEYLDFFKVDIFIHFNVRTNGYETGFSYCTRMRIKMYRPRGTSRGNHLSTLFFVGINNNQPWWYIYSKYKSKMSSPRPFQYWTNNSYNAFISLVMYL